MHVAMVLFPELTQLDLTGPFEILRRIPGARVSLVAKTREPVVAEGGLAIVPMATFAEAGACDVLFVPGGWGQVAAADDAETLAFVRAAGERARWVTSACTGALLLGAAGLLEGYRATTHWAYVDLLPIVGAIPTAGRVVIDRNRITAGGVTAGIDFALRLVAEVAGDHVAQAIQLGLEYDPMPPFRAGHPDSAPPALVAELRAQLQARHDERRRQLTRAAR